MLFVQGSNPAVTAPRQQLVLEGLARDDLFTVVHDQVLTDTALYADVVLPATTHFEADDLAGSYGSFTRQRVAAVIDRVGESRTNDEVGAGLAARLGLDMQRFDTDPDALMTEGLAGGAAPRAGEVEVLHQPGGAVQFRDTFPGFEDGKAGSAPPILREGAVPSYRELESSYPLALITPATHRTINSMFGEFNAAEACVRMHPDDAAARAVADGDTVRMWNDLGAIEVIARLDARPSARRRVDAEGPLAARRAGRAHRQRARARHPQRPRRWRVLQRRPCRDRAGQASAEELDPVAVWVFDDRDRDAGPELDDRHGDLVSRRLARVDDLLDVVDADRPVAVAERGVHPAGRAPGSSFG